MADNKSSFGTRFSDERFAVIDKAIRAYRKRTGETKSYADITREGARKFVEENGGTWAE
jgi:hypothetical protein